MGRLVKGLRAVPAAAVVVALAACGVPLSDTAEPIPGARPTTQAPNPSASPTQTAVATVWFVDGARLVPRARAAQTPVTATTVLALLTVGPPERSGLRTLIPDPLGGPPLASLPAVLPSAIADVDQLQPILLSPTFGELSAADQVLLIGQVVLTLTEVDRRPVIFVDDAGAPLSVPLPDGRLRDGPVTRGDYLSLA